MSAQRSRRIVGLMLAGAVLAWTAIGDRAPLAPAADRGADIAVSMPRAGDDRLDRCGELRGEGADVSGGCVVKVADERSKMSILTMFSRMPFATCGFEYDLHVGSDGTVAFADVGITTVKGPCADAVACLDPASTFDDVRKIPWRGSIEAAGQGGFRLTVDACLDTCVGRFEGPLELDLLPSGPGWALEARSAPIGKSGFLLDGRWNVGRMGLEPRDQS
jgi:hypothetical protein